jgi:outer membrane protein assembly factor BamB
MMDRDDQPQEVRMPPTEPRRQMAHDRSSGPPIRAMALAAGAVLMLAIAVLGISAAPTASPGRSDAADAVHPSGSLATSAPSARPRTGSPSAGVGDPAASAPSPPAPTAAPPSTPVPAGPFAGDLMIADRQNGRILIVDTAGAIRWRFPVAGSLPAGQRFAADDAFLAPDGKTIVANEEGHEVVVRIDIATRRVIWEYGRYDVAGHGPGELHTPDDAYPLANGDVIVADIFNCRVIEISPAKHIVRQWGRTGVCTDHAPTTYGEPNGDTPLPDGGMLITEITGSRVVRLDASGHVVFDVHVPTRYPSDAQPDSKGNILVVDYSNPGAIVRVDPHGHVLWRYGPRSGPGRLDHPSLAIELPNGLLAVNDDFRHRVLVIDPGTDRIVWQYGHTDHHGRADGFLFTPDGIDQIPPEVAAGL